VDDDHINDSDLNQTNNNSWVPKNKILNFSTKIHKNNLLIKVARTNILKEQPQNAKIKYEAPTIDKRIWKLMSLQAKKTDKLLLKITYQSLATFCPLDNTFRAIYYTKANIYTEALQA
ncbi:34864_t:CDS:1, partial [Gigaspora margarita]